MIDELLVDGAGVPCRIRRVERAQMFLLLMDSTTFENEIINLVFDRALSSNKRRWARHVRPRRQTLGE